MTVPNLAVSESALRFNVADDLQFRQSHLQVFVRSIGHSLSRTPSSASYLQTNPASETQACACVMDGEHAVHTASCHVHVRSYRVR